MNLKDFQTILVPSNKTGALQFYHKPTKAILEAAFSRPDIGATSGATVFRDGQLIELGENDPDWDDANGCPRLLMRPQSMNFFNNALGLNVFGATLSATSEIAPDGSTNVERVTFTGGTQGVRINDNITHTLGETWADGMHFKFDGSPISLAVAFSIGSTTSASGSFSFDGSGNPSSTGDVGYISLPNDWYYVYIVANIDLGTNTGRFNFISSSATTILCWSNGSQYEKRTYPSAFIPTNGSAETRSVNQFTFDDLVTKGVMGENSSYSFLFYAPDSVGNPDGNTPAGLWFYNDLVAVWNFWTVNNAILRRPYKYVEGTGYINFGNANYPANEAILCTYDGQTINFYNSSGLLSTFSFTAPQAINKLFIDGSVLNHSFKGGYIAFSPTVFNEAQAIQAIADVQNL